MANPEDTELKDQILQELREYPTIDVDLIEVDVHDSAVTVRGRIGTEQEYQQIENVITDLVDVDNLNNELVIDELVRGERSEAADEAWVEDSSLSASDTAEHLMDDIEAEQFGTDDPQEAVQRGIPYEPPSEPVQDGTSSLENH